MTIKTNLLKFLLQHLNQFKIQKQNMFLIMKYYWNRMRNYHKLQLNSSCEEEGCSIMRYAVFLQNFISLLDTNQKQILYLSEII